MEKTFFTKLQLALNLDLETCLFSCCGFIWVARAFLAAFYLLCLCFAICIASYLYIVVNALEFRCVQYRADCTVYPFCKKNLKYVYNMGMDIFLNWKCYKGAFVFALAVVLLVPALVQQHIYSIRSRKLQVTRATAGTLSPNLTSHD